MWYFNPCFDTEITFERSSLDPFWRRYRWRWTGRTRDSSFLLRKMSLLLVLHRKVEGLDFFLTFSAGMATPLDSMEKMKLEPAVREREKVRPWLARVWHRARHCFAKEESPADASSIADILDEYLN